MLLEKRLTHTEDQVSLLLANARGFSTSLAAASQSANTSRNISISEEPQLSLFLNAIDREIPDRQIGDVEIVDVQGKEDEESAAHSSYHDTDDAFDD